jgi:hypothetical protein
MRIELNVFKVHDDIFINERIPEAVKEVGLEINV